MKARIVQMLTFAIATATTASACSSAPTATEGVSVSVKVIDNGQSSEGSPETSQNMGEPDEQVDQATSNEDKTRVVLDERNEGEIERPFGIDIWTFEAEKGQTLTIEFHNEGVCFLDAQVVLSTPTGEQIKILDSIIGCRAHGPTVLEGSGNYQIEFVGGSGKVALHPPTGKYIFTPYLS